MARGFKDDKGNFHPTDRTLPKMPSRFHDGTKKMGVDGVGITKQLLKQTGIFARKRADEFKKKQDQIKERQIRELKLRRDAEKRIVSSFKRARDLQIKDPVALKNQILIDVPEIQDNKENLKFIENILNGFIKREKKKDKAIKKAKSDTEKIAIQEAFDRAEGAEEKEVRDEIKRVITRQEKEISKKAQKEQDDLKKKKKQSDDLLHQAEKDIQDIIKDEVATTEAEKEAKKKKEETERKQIEAEKRETVVTFADEALRQAKDQDKATAIKEGLKSDRFVAGQKADTALDELVKVQKETIEAENKADEKREKAEEKRDDVENLLETVEQQPIQVEPSLIDESSFPLEIV